MEATTKNINTNNEAICHNLLENLQWACEMARKRPTTANIASQLGRMMVYRNNARYQISSVLTACVDTIYLGYLYTLQRIPCYRGDDEETITDALTNLILEEITATRNMIDHGTDADQGAVIIEA